MNPELNTHTQTQNTSDINPSSHSTAPTTDVCPIPRDSTIIEQQQQRITALEAELARIRQAADQDIQNLQNDIVAKNRELGRIRAELVKLEEEEPEHGEVHELLLLWKALTNRNGKTDIKAGGKRHKLVKAAVKRWGRDRTEHAIRGLALKPYVGPRGRSHEDYLGAKRQADIEHALSDEVRFERCEGYWQEHVNPTLETPVLELVPDPPAQQPQQQEEGIVRQFVRHVYGPDCKLTGREPRWPAKPWDTIPPIDKILGALNTNACQWKPGTPDSWSAQCPAHEDRTPSLSIHRKADGMILLHCWAGCDTADVLAALQLDFRDLWTGGEHDHERSGGEWKRPAATPLHQQLRQILVRMEEAA